RYSCGPLGKARLQRPAEFLRDLDETARRRVNLILPFGIVRDQRSLSWDDDDRLRLRFRRDALQHGLKLLQQRADHAELIVADGDLVKIERGLKPRANEANA